MRSYRRRRPASNLTPRLPRRRPLAPQPSPAPEPVRVSAFDTPTLHLIGHAEELIREFRALDERAVGEILDCGRRLDQVLGRIAALDPAMAAELRADLEAPEPADPAAWPAWTDADCWEPAGAAGGADLGLADPADAHDDDQGEPDELLTLPEWIEAQAGRYQDLATQAGELIGQTLRELAGLVRATGATVPAAVRPRVASDN